MSYEIKRSSLALADMLDTACASNNTEVTIKITDDEVRAIYEQKKHDYAVEDVLANAEDPSIFDDHPEELEDVAKKYMELLDNDDTWYDILMDCIEEAEKRLADDGRMTPAEFAKKYVTPIREGKSFTFRLSPEDGTVYRVTSIVPFGRCYYVFSTYSGNLHTFSIDSGNEIELATYINDYLRYNRDYKGFLYDT